MKLWSRKSFIFTIFAFGFFLRSPAEGSDHKSINLKTLDGLNISAQEWGNPAGKEILFIHGYSQSHLSWLPQVRSEILKGCRLITYDLRGHGNSDKPAGDVWYASGLPWADEVNAVMNAFNLRSPLIVTWSFGGLVVLDYLVKFGDQRISGINFVAALTKQRSKPVPHSEIFKLMGSTDLEENIHGTIDFVKLLTFMPLSEEGFRKVLAYNMKMPAYVRDAFTHGTVPWGSYENSLKNLRVSVLVSQGLADSLVPLEMSEYTARIVPHGKLSVYPAIGHSPFLEDSTRFNQELSDLVLKDQMTNLWQRF